MKRQPTEWEKIFADDVTDKGLISKINNSYNSISKNPTKTYKETQTKTTSNPIKTWAEDLNRHFAKEGIQMQQAHEKMLSVANY